MWSSRKINDHTKDNGELIELFQIRRMKENKKIVANEKPLIILKMEADIYFVYKFVSKI